MKFNFAHPKPIRRIDPIEPMTTVFIVRPFMWRACWRGQVSPTTFNSKGAALAYLATCDAAGKLRS
jgi:hypothetical protein